MSIMIFRDQFWLSFWTCKIHCVYCTFFIVSFLSYDDSERYGIKRIFGCTDITSLAEDGEFIRDIIVSRAGDISILLNTNKIIYGKVSFIETYISVCSTLGRASQDLRDCTKCICMLAVPFLLP